ncbi:MULTISPECIES: NADPH-dependent FMN reductase [unclassified Streptomyces]|uniref:NADPH-dependent FMN reductase n=1 Tax=unclassified Streptomyces TaxID=2593676 RepID=UPI003816DC38
MTKIVLISGSVRRDSLNASVLATVRRLLAGRPDGDAYEIESLSVGLLPHFDWDVEQADGSPEVRAAKRLVGDADAVFISTPAYNGEMPGVLKNALDWLSRPNGESALTGRTVALTSASPGARGAVDAQTALARVLVRCGARVVDHPPVAVGRAGQLRTAEGDFTDPATVAALGTLIDATLAAVREPAGAGA